MKLFDEEGKVRSGFFVLPTFSLDKYFVRDAFAQTPLAKRETSILYVRVMPLAQEIDRNPFKQSNTTAIQHPFNFNQIMDYSVP